MRVDFTVLVDMVNLDEFCTNNLNGTFIVIIKYQAKQVLDENPSAFNLRIRAYIIIPGGRLFIIESKSVLKVKCYCHCDYNNIFPIQLLS